MRLGARLLVSVLLLTLYLPAGAALADSDFLSVTLASTETAGVVDHTLTVTAMSGEVPDPTYTGTIHFITSDSGTGVVLPEDYTFTGTDGDEGSATFDVTLVTAGPQTVTAIDTNDGAITGEGDTTVDAGPADTIDMTGTDASDLISGSTKDVTALVLDAFGNPVVGQSVAFSQTLGSGSVSGTGSAPTDSSGVATDTVTGVLVGAVTITGTTAIALSTTASFVVTAGAAATLDLTGGTGNLASGATRILTATVKDAAGNGISGHTVDFTQSVVGGSVSGLSSPITNSLGVANDTVTGVLAGSVTVTATDGGLNDALTFTVISGPAANLVVTQNTGSIASGGTKAVTATVTDLATNPISGASVVFTQSGTGTVAPTTTVSTNGSGVATDTVTAVKAGPITITATDGGLNDHLDFTITAGAAATLVVTQDTGSIASGATKDVIATVKDAAGNPVSGASVTFAKSSGVGSVSGTTTVSTDASGVATNTVTGVLAGSVTITATDGALNGSLTFTITAGAAASLVVGGSTSTLASGATRAVTATVKDAATNPVSGASVAFGQSGTGTVSGPTSAPTNSSGVASVTLTGVMAGAITITATLGGLNGHLDFTITAGAVNHITVTPFTSTITPGSQSYTTTAFDAAGNTTDVTGTAVLSITPDGSCTSTSCSAVAVGAHTVTSTYLAKTDTATLTIQNVAPTANDDPETVLENAPSTAFDVLANDTDPNVDSLIVTAVSTPSHGTASVDVGGGGVHYHPTAHFNGSDSFNYSISDGHGGVDTANVTVTITHVNEVPSFTKGANDTVLENSSARTVAGWATAISPGVDPTESGQTVTFIVSNDNNGLFSSQPMIDTSGNLTYTPGVNTNGTATVSVQAHDTGGTANGGVDTSAIQTFTIILTLVNQAPSFTKGADQTVLEDAIAQAVPGWASSISSGPGDPFQSPTFTVTNDNNALFSSQPDVAANGALTFTTAANANGSSIVSVTLHDNGGTANSGQDTSPTQTFTITVTPVNDAPSFVKGADQTLAEEGSADNPVVTQTVASWATGFIAGPPDESTQTVLAYTVTNNNHGLFGIQPSINPSGNLTYRLAANRNGTATVSVTVQDSGGTANGGHDTSSPAQTFTITVMGVDHPPAAVNDFPVVVQGSGPNSIDVLANDFDPDTDPMTIIAVCLTGPVRCGPSVTTAKGRAVIAADKKSLTYDPTGSLTGTDTFQYEISDGRGQVNFGSVQVSIVKDTFGPVSTAPKIWTMSTTSTTVTIQLKWTGTDQGYGVKYYQLQESRNGGAYVALGVPAGATSFDRTVANGSSFTYRVRGVDQVGNVGAWVVSEAFVPAAIPRPAPPTRHPPAAPLVRATLGSTGPSVSRRGTTGFLITP